MEFGMEKGRRDLGMGEGGMGGGEIVPTYLFIFAFRSHGG